MNIVRTFSNNIIDHMQYECSSSDDIIVPLKIKPKSNDSLYSLKNSQKLHKLCIES